MHSVLLRFVPNFHSAIRCPVCTDLSKDFLLKLILKIYANLAYLGPRRNSTVLDLDCARMRAINLIEKVIP